MKRFLVRGLIAGLFALSVALCSWGQKSGSQGAPGSTGSGSSGSPGSSAPPVQSGGTAVGNQGQQQSRPQFQSILNVNGRIVMDTGQPVPEPVSIALSCGVRTVQVIQTDFKGYFQFTLGSGIQSNIDFSASNNSPGNSTDLGPSSSDNGYQGFGNSEGRLTGCELRVSLPGYQPLSKIITEPADITGVEVGTLRLERIAGVVGSSISVTSLLVPGNARKEFEKGDKDARTNHLDSAAQHLEKAVAQYDKYAAAWNELGNLYSARHEMEKSASAFKSAISVDPRYIPPYVGLANLQWQNQEFEASVETAGRALDLDPSNGLANLISALANFKLNRLDEAQKSAEAAEKGPHQNMPQLHPLLVDIFLQKQDYTNAAIQMQAYLKEFPHGQFASEMKKDLEQIEKSSPAAEEAAPATQ